MPELAAAGWARRASRVSSIPESLRVRSAAFPPSRACGSPTSTKFMRTAPRAGVGSGSGSLHGRARGRRSRASQGLDARVTTAGDTGHSEGDAVLVAGSRVPNRYAAPSAGRLGHAGSGCRPARLLDESEIEQRATFGGHPRLHVSRMEGSAVVLVFIGRPAANRSDTGILGKPYESGGPGWGEGAFKGGRGAGSSVCSAPGSRFTWQAAPRPRRAPTQVARHGPAGRRHRGNGWPTVLTLQSLHHAHPAVGRRSCCATDRPGTRSWP